MPIETDGKYKNNIIAFARVHRPYYSITVAPRFLTGVIENGTKPLGRDVWEDTQIILPKGAPSLWKEVIAGTEHKGKKKLFVGDVLKRFPSALRINIVKK